jgi:putative ABC transport system permease protein
MMTQDVRFAARMLVKRPGFSSIAILTLALGIGASTAIFSVVHSVLLRSLPYPEPDRILQLYETANGAVMTFSPLNYLDWKAQARTFESIAAYAHRSVTLTGATEAERLDAAAVRADLFAVLGVPPFLGRTLEPADEQPAGSRATVLGHGLWLRRFGGDPHVVGRTLTFDGVPHQVVGVMPRHFSFPDGVDLWIPLVITPGELTPNQRGAHYLLAVGRLRPGVSIETARAELRAIHERLAAQHSAVQGYGAWAQPFLHATVGSVREPLAMLLGAVGFVLLIACANVSTLLLASATTRRAEMAVRCALGAARWRIAQQLLVESVLLAMAGGALGVLLAAWGVRGLDAVLPQDLPRGDAIGVNSTVLLFSVTISVLTGVLFGIAPAVYASATTNLSVFLKDARRHGGSSTSGGGVRGLLVGAEIALAVMLLAGAGLAMRSFARLTAIDPGFDARQTVALGLSLPEQRDLPSVARFGREFVEMVAAQPGVVSAGSVSTPPLTLGGVGGTFTIPGSTRTDDLAMSVRAATAGYFETLRIPIVRGRGLTRGDHESAPRVAILSAEAARRFWPGEDPIGQRIHLHVAVGAPETERLIVGIAGDVRMGRIERSPGPVVYVPHAQYPTRRMTVFARAAGDRAPVAGVLRNQLRRMDPALAPTRIDPGEALVAASIAQPRFRTILLSLFAAAALTLAAIGLYGVTAFSVSQRRTELGLRMALGADPASLVRLVLRQGARPIAAGLVTGIAGAAGLAQVFSALFFDMPRVDPLTFAGVPVLLASVAALACYIPARRAALLDPLAALRE